MQEFSIESTKLYRMIMSVVEFAIRANDSMLETARPLGFVRLDIVGYQIRLLASDRYSVARVETGLESRESSAERTTLLIARADLAEVARRLKALRMHTAPANLPMSLDHEGRFYVGPDLVPTQGVDQEAEQAFTTALSFFGVMIDRPVTMLGTDLMIRAFKSVKALGRGAPAHVETGKPTRVRARVDEIELDIIAEPVTGISKIATRRR